jgi:predicted transcriptional regulator
MARGLSTQKLAELARVGHSTISEAERGRPVRRVVLDRLAEVLGPDAYGAVVVSGLPTEDTAVALACRQRRLPVADAAKRAGVGYDVMKRAVTGARVHPANAKRIADAFGLDVIDVAGVFPRDEAA